MNPTSVELCPRSNPGMDLPLFYALLVLLRCCKLRATQFIKFFVVEYVNRGLEFLNLCGGPKSKYFKSNSKNTQNILLEFDVED